MVSLLGVKQPENALSIVKAVAKQSLFICLANSMFGREAHTELVVLGQLVKTRMNVTRPLPRRSRLLQLKLAENGLP